MRRRGHGQHRADEGETGAQVTGNLEARGEDEDEGPNAGEEQSQLRSNPIRMGPARWLRTSPPRAAFPWAAGARKESCLRDRGSGFGAYPHRVPWRNAGGSRAVVEGKVGSFTGRPDLQRDPAGPRQWFRRPALRFGAIRRRWRRHPRHCRSCSTPSSDAPIIRPNRPGATLLM